MLFNSTSFLLFFFIVFLVYWNILRNKLDLQNLLLLFSSLVFYSIFSLPYLGILIVVIFFNYLIASGIHLKKSEHSVRFFYLIGITGNLSLLLYFKYFQFILDIFYLKNSVNNILKLGNNVIVPLGISFYIFHAISYLIDLKRGVFYHKYNIINFSLFFTFFPFLAAGPIERSNTLLPQFYIRRTFSYEKASSGLKQFILGLAKKVVVADSISVVVDNIFNNYSQFSGITLLIGAIGFSFQIYADFSGYSDMAIGMSRLLGFDLTNNFNFPYFSYNLVEFWKRWHISLTNWFRDYLYIPLGGNKGSIIHRNSNILIVFLLSGLWHGASWNFLFWGFINGIAYIFILNVKKSFFSNVSLPIKFLNVFITFIFVTLTWIPFRLHNLTDSYNYFISLTHINFKIIFNTIPNGISIFLYIIPIVIFDFFSKYKVYRIDLFEYKSFKHIFYFIISMLIFFFWGRNDFTNFIYFNF